MNLVSAVDWAESNMALTLSLANFFIWNQELGSVVNFVRLIACDREGTRESDHSQNEGFEIAT